VLTHEVGINERYLCGPFANAMSVAFHIIFAAIGVALSPMMVICQKMNSRRDSLPAIEIDAEEDGLSEEGKAFQRKRHADDRTGKPHEARPQQAKVERCTFLAARTGDPDIYAGLLRPSLVWIVQGATAAYAIAALVALQTRKYKVARTAAMFQVGLILWGWGLSQFPFFLQGDMTVSESAAARPGSMGTDWCNSRRTPRLVCLDFVSDANLQSQP
jgi:hypothetical protein